MHATIISKPWQAPTSTSLKKKLLSLEEITNVLYTLNVARVSQHVVVVAVDNQTYILWYVRYCQKQIRL